jgi:hypothetical protein
MSVAEDVHPFSIFFVPEIGLNDDAMVGRTVFKVALVGNLTDSDHSIAGREVRNIVDLSRPRLQANKKPLHGLADLVAALIDLAARPNEEDVGAARKQAHDFFRVEQPVPFEELSVQFLVCRKNVARQSLRGLRLRGNGQAA